jgi:hypothetical protein
MRLLACLVATVVLAVAAHAGLRPDMDGNYVILTAKDAGVIAPEPPQMPYPAGYALRKYEAAMRLRIYGGVDGRVDDVKVRKSSAIEFLAATP